MNKRRIAIFLLSTGFFLVTCSTSFGSVEPASATGSTPIIVQLTPTSINPLAVISTPNAPPPPTGLSSINWFDATIFVAAFGGIVAIVAAIIGLFGVIINPFITQWATARGDRKKEAQAEQARKDKEAQEAINAQKRRQDEEDARLAAEETQKKTLEGYVQQYRERLRKDDNVASIKILDMSRPVELANVYVQLKLRQDVTTSATGTLDAIKKELDPNIFLQVMRKRMEENYARQAIDPVQALRDNRQCILLGDPGAGKTTLLKYLTVQILDKSVQVSGLPALPIFVELSKFAEAKCENLEEFIARRWDNSYGFPLENARAYIEQQLDAENVVLLLDGLDEAASGKNKEAQDESYRCTFDAITRIVTRHPQLYIMVTARVAGYKQRTPLAAFTELEVLDFRKEDIQKFVRNWFAGTDAEKVRKGRDLNIQLDNNIRIQTLAANPLLLSLIVILYEQREKLPERRAELYKQCVNMLLNAWDRRQKNLQRNVVLSVDKKRNLLKLVAWYFHNRQERYFPEDSLLKEIGRVLPDIGLQPEQHEQVLEEISAETGLLKEQAGGWYGFLHLTFQEYFVALYMLDKRLQDELLIHRGEPSWEEVILLYAGSTDEIKPLIKKLLALDDDIFATNVILAGRCLAANSGVDREVEALQKQIITHLFEILEHTPYDLNRTNAADALAELGRVEETINTRFLVILADDNANSAVVQAIAHSLSIYGKRSLVDKLQELLFNPSTPKYRDQIALILRDLNSSSATPALWDKLLDKTTPLLIREDIVTILGGIADHTLSAQLLPLLLDSQEDEDLRLSIASAWYELADSTDTARLLTEIFDPKTDASSFTVIIVALSFLDDPAIASASLQLLKTNKAISQNIDVIATMLLRNTNDKVIIDEIANVIADQQIDLAHRLQIVSRLRSSDKKDEILKMMQYIYTNKTIEARLKQEIMLSLYVLGDKSISIDTQSILKTSRVAGDIERTIIERTPVSVQLQMLADPDFAPLVRTDIAESLTNINDPTIVPHLCSLVANRRLHLDVRKAIIGTLQKIADDEATVQVLVGLMNSDQQLQNEAEHALWYVSKRADIRVVEDEMTRKVKIG